MSSKTNKEDIVVEKLDTETILLAQITKKGSQITIQGGNDTNDFELYGFLKVYVKRLEEDMVGSLERT